MLSGTLGGVLKFTGHRDTLPREYKKIALITMRFSSKQVKFKVYILSIAWDSMTLGGPAHEKHCCIHTIVQRR